MDIFGHHWNFIIPTSGPVGLFRRHIRLILRFFRSRRLMLFWNMSKMGQFLYFPNSVYKQADIDNEAFKKRRERPPLCEMSIREPFRLTSEVFLLNCSSITHWPMTCGECDQKLDKKKPKSFQKLPKKQPQHFLLKIMFIRFAKKVKHYLATFVRKCVANNF